MDRYLPRGGVLPALPLILPRNKHTPCGLFLHGARGTAPVTAESSFRGRKRK